jgi:lipopolysaccharide/colanic/teichoic acid biosynthesis glycosyltransferase
MLKFRTMCVDAERRLVELRDGNERTGPLFKMEDDPRVTRVGRVLRATSLDELPQLWNVLRGDMSLVGPRPCLPDERDAFPPRLLGREAMPQGMTGYWQLKARDEPCFQKYLDLDLAYVEGWSLWRDLWILACTPGVVGQQTFRRLQRWRRWARSATA